MYLHFCYENNSFYKYQAGLSLAIPGYSKYLKHITTLYKSIGNGKMYCMIFCNMSKDMVWHEALHFKLQTYGMCGHLLQ